MGINKEKCEKCVFFEPIKETSIPEGFGTCVHDPKCRFVVSNDYKCSNFGYKQSPLLY